MNRSLAKVFLAGLRFAGKGTYHPAHTKPDGTKVNARWEGSFFINNSYTDRQTNAKVDNNNVIRLTAWNGNTAAPGKGLADTMAKYCAPGKEISCECRINSYNGRVFDPILNQPLGDSQGNLLMTPKISFEIVPGSLNLGDDSAKLVAQEVANYVGNGGQTTFDGRPADWNVPGPGQIAWQGIRDWRTMQCFQPTLTTYGYSAVGQVSGTPVSSHTAAQAPTPAPAAAGTAADPVAAAKAALLLAEQTAAAGGAGGAVQAQPVSY